EPEDRQDARSQGRQDVGCSGVGRREGRHRRRALHHGRRRQGGVRHRAADLPGHGQDDHVSRTARFRRLHQARQPDHRRRESHRRSTKVQIRRVRKGDLAKARHVIEQTFTDFLERQLGTRPRQPFGGAQYVHHRWLMEPWGCFVAEEDQSKIVGAALAVTWGAVGLLGPVAVLTNYQNQKIGQQLILAVEEFFEENKTALQGVVTYPTSPKHLLLYSKFGYRPKGLVAI